MSSAQATRPSRSSTGRRPRRGAASSVSSCTATAARPAARKRRRRPRSTWSCARSSRGCRRSRRRPSPTSHAGGGAPRPSAGPRSSCSSGTTGSAGSRHLDEGGAGAPQRDDRARASARNDGGRAYGPRPAHCRLRHTNGTRARRTRSVERPSHGDDRRCPASAAAAKATCAATRRCAPQRAARAGEWAWRSAVAPFAIVLPPQDKWATRRRQSN